MKSAALTILIFISLGYCTKNPETSRKFLTFGKFKPKLSTIYQKKQAFTFLAKYYNTEGGLVDEDTIILSTSNKKWNEDSLQYSIDWTKQKLSFYAITESTGVIDNENEVWIHPPRQWDCSILELCPFPHIKYPLEIGKKWNSQLQIGEHYGNKQWAEWEGDIISYNDYEIKEIKDVQTSFGILVCYEVMATSKSSVGNTSLKILFNERYGFVKLDFNCINKSRIEMSLVSVLALNDNEITNNFITRKK